MLLDEDPDTLVAEIGHDGTSIQFPGLPEPACFRGIHIQEVIDCCMRRGYGLTPIEPLPRSGPQGRKEWALVYDLPELRFMNAVAGSPGIIIGKAGNGGNHAFAWDGDMVFDPNGAKKQLTDILIKEVWILTTLIPKTSSQKP